MKGGLGGGGRERKEGLIARGDNLYAGPIENGGAMSEHTHTYAWAYFHLLYAGGGFFKVQCHFASNLLLVLVNSWSRNHSATQIG